MKDILIITNFASTFSFSDNDRFLYLANMLTDVAKVEIVTSDFCHERKEHRYETENKWPFQITFLYEPGYRRNVCLKRFYSHLVWGNSIKDYLKTRKKPDVVYCAVPSLSGPAFLADYCRKNKIKFIVDIQDLWPEAFRLILDIPIISPALFSPFSLLANKVYRNADEIVAVSETYVRRALRVNKSVKKGHVVFLGTDIKVFDGYALKEVTIPKQNLWVGYCGTLGSSYDLTCIFDALDILKHNGARVPTLIIMGDGPLKQNFELYAEKKQIDCIFTGRIPYDEMCALISRCDIAVNPIMHGAAQSIINKHADYVASGLPIISTQENEEFRNLIDQYAMGINCSNDPSELANAFSKIISDKELRIELGKNARRCAEERFDRRNTYQEIVKLILS